MPAGVGGRIVSGMSSSSMLAALMPIAEGCDAIIRGRYADMGACIKILDQSPLRFTGERRAFNFNGVFVANSAFSLNINSIFHPNGFNNGDVFSYFLEEWAGSRGWVSELVEDDRAHIRNPYLNQRYFLWKVWERFVAPNISAELARSVKYQESGWSAVRKVNPLCFLSESRVVMKVLSNVRVPLAELEKLADEMFPARSDEWLAIFHGIYFARPEPDDMVDGEVFYNCSVALADLLSKAAMEIDRSVLELFLGLAYPSFEIKRLGGADAVYATVGALVV